MLRVSITASKLLTTTQLEFWGEDCCCHLRVQVLMVGGVRRQRRDLGGGDVVRLRRRPAAETSYVVNTKVLC